MFDMNRQLKPSSFIALSRLVSFFILTYALNIVITVTQLYFGPRKLSRESQAGLALSISQ